MTALTRPVRRECCRTFDGGVPVVIIANPGDVIEFRLKRKRVAYRVTIAEMYSYAVKKHVRAMQAEKQKNRRRR